MRKLRYLSLVLAVAVVAASAASFASAAGPTTVALGTADQFAVLAGSGITNTGPTTITGDIGSYPTATITGRSSITLNGTDHGGDAVTQDAKNALVTAYNDAAAKTPTTTVLTELGGTTLGGGTYSAASGTFGVTGTLTLDGQNDSTSVWVFQMASTLTTAASSSIVLTNGAQACNVFWQVGSSATLGASNTFVGNILALASITVGTSSSIDGRALARDGAVTLASNTIARSTCAAPTPTPSPAATATASPMPSATPAPSATPTPSAAPLPTATPTPSVTATPIQAPAATATPATPTSAPPVTDTPAAMPVAATPAPVSAVAPAFPTTPVLIDDVAFPVAGMPSLVVAVAPIAGARGASFPVIRQLPATSTSTECEAPEPPLRD